MIILFYLFSIPVAYALFYMVRKASKGGDLIMAGAASFIIVASFLYLHMIMQYWPERVPQTAALLPLTQWCGPLIFMSIHLFFCRLFNRPFFSLTTVCLASFVFYNLVGGVTVYLGDESTKAFAPDGHVHFMYNNRQVGSIGICEVSMWLMILWIIARFVVYTNRMKSMKLHFSSRCAFFFRASVATLVINFILMILPHSWYSGSIIIPLLTLLVYSASLSFASMMFAQRYCEKPILDENNEPAVGTFRFSKVDLLTDIRQIIEREHQYLNPDISTEMIARILNTNRQYVEETVQESLDKSFSSYIMNLRIEDALAMMRKDKSLTMEAIAMATGFNTASTFTKNFRKVTGYNPTEMRERTK